MFLIAHLTDIHVADALDPVLARGDAIAAAIGSQASECELVVLAITGDIAFSGLRDQYQLAIPFLRQIRSKLEEDYRLRVEFVVCPGNHDCDFSKDQEFREMALSKIAAGTTPSERAIDECTAVQHDFFCFLRELNEFAPSSPEERLRYGKDIAVDGTEVRFDCINLSWVSKLREDKISFPATIIPQAKERKGLTITLMHHPFNWLNPASYREFRKRVRANTDLLLTGHEHQWSVVETTDSESGRCIQIEGGVLQERRHPELSTFNVVAVDIGRELYAVRSYEWLDDHYVRAKNESWSTYRPLSIADAAGSWGVTDEFERELSDVGMSLRVSAGQEITLQDIYVFPDLQRKSNEDDADSKQISSVESLISHRDNVSGYVLEGDERSGRSALMAQLVWGYLAAGFVPLRIHGRRFSRSAENEIESVIAAEFKRQLKGRDLDAYLQLPPAKRVLLLDDIDEIAIKSEKAVEQLVQRLRSRFGVLVVSASDVFDVAQFAQAEGGGALEDLPTYRLLPFGHLARTRLIKKWVNLNSDEGHSEDDRVARVHAAEQFVGAVLNRGVVPAYPLYLVTLLHASQNRERESLQDAGYGQYYEYLIGEGVDAAGIRKDKWDEIYSYCTELAWFVTASGHDTISTEDLLRFNRQFSDEYLTVDFATRRDELVQARLLKITGDAVSFRYPYLQYYFVARYVSANLDEAECWDFIEKSAKEIYVRSKANTLIFLTHFTTRAEVIDVILSSLSEQFKNIQIAQFNERHESVEALLRELPKLTYAGGDPLVNRERAAKSKDTHEQGDGLAERAENGEKLSLPARLTTVFKSVEIVGQILKARYSNFKRPRKEKMIEEVIQGPLRALEEFYEVLRRHPDAIVAEFNSAIGEKNSGLTDEEKKKVAMQVSGFVVLAISLHFLRKIAEAISADVLKEDVENVVEQHQELAYKLVGLACALDGQRPLPRAKIEGVLRQGDGSLIVESLVRILTLYRMYMFRTSASDIQWVSDNLKIPTRAKIQSLLRAL